MDKLVNSNVKQIKTMVLILQDLNNLLHTKLNAQHSTNIDDIFSSTYEFIESGSSQQFQQPPTSTSYFEELFSKKIQLFDDNLFMKEFRNTTVQIPNSFLPQDVGRIVKSINENSTYLASFQFTQAIIKEELISFMDKELMNLNDLIKNYENSDSDVCF